MPEDPNDPVPHGQTSYTDGAFLPFRAGHPHVDELNNPTAFGDRPHMHEDPVAFKQWEQDRADSMKEHGSPIHPPEEPPVGPARK
jgi:hypothetical protein